MLDKIYSSIKEKNKVRIFRCFLIDLENVVEKIENDEFFNEECKDIVIDSICEFLQSLKKKDDKRI